MKLDYNIIWVEDKIQERPFQALIRKVSTFLESQFFKVKIDTAEDFSDFKEKLRKEKSFDLIITDLNLNESLGSEVIDFIRNEKHILTEIFFYSANGDVKNRPLINNNRITFYQLESQNYHKELGDEIISLISLTIAKFQHVISMRGMIMHETSSLDIKMLEIIKKALSTPSIDFSSLSDSVYTDLLELYAQKSKFIDECREKGRFKDLAKDTFVFSADYKIKTLGQILSSLNISDFSLEYKEEINNIRNKFAHSVLQEDENGRQFFKHGNSGLTFDENLCKKIRSDIIKHESNIAKLEDILKKT